jgi:hypothetical protein
MWKRTCPAASAALLAGSALSGCATHDSSQIIVLPVEVALGTLAERHHHVESDDQGDVAPLVLLGAGDELGWQLYLAYAARTQDPTGSSIQCR